MNYFIKYIKYKKKYLNLKNQIGGSESEFSDSDSEYEYPESDEESDLPVARVSLVPEGVTVDFPVALPANQNSRALQPDEESNKKSDEKKEEVLTEEQILQLVLSDSLQEEIKRKEAENEAEEIKRQHEETKKQHEETKKQHEETKKQQIEQDPRRRETVYNEFVEKISTDYENLQKKKDYELLALYRLIVLYDHSSFLDNIIPHTSAFWKSQNYKIDIQYGLNAVQPEIIRRIFEMRTKLINFMKASYKSEDYDYDVGVWPTSQVSFNKHTNEPLDVKHYDEKWNLLMQQPEIKEHFKKNVINELLLFVGGLYTFYKYPNL
jgi:hypothetical protein